MFETTFLLKKRNIISKKTCIDWVSARPLEHRHIHNRLSLRAISKLPHLSPLMSLKAASLDLSINDLPAKFPSAALLFFDDCLLYLTIRSPDNSHQPQHNPRKNSGRWLSILTNVKSSTSTQRGNLSQTPQQSTKHHWPCQISWCHHLFKPLLEQTHW